MALLAGLGAAGGAAGGLGGLGSIFGLVGTVLQASAAKQAANAEADAAEYNAKINEQRAQQERDAAEASSEDFRRKEGAKKASAIADLGASGVQIAGTPLLLLSDIEQEIELGAARIGNTGATRATSYENSATLDRFKASNSRKAGSLAAGASLIGGVSKFF